MKNAITGILLPVIIGCTLMSPAFAADPLTQCLSMSGLYNPDGTLAANDGGYIEGVGGLGTINTFCSNELANLHVSLPAHMSMQTIYSTATYNDLTGKCTFSNPIQCLLRCDSGYKWKGSVYSSSTVLGNGVGLSSLSCIEDKASCPAGTYRMATSEGGHTCINCRAGTYQTANGFTGTSCTKCPKYPFTTTASNTCGVTVSATPSGSVGATSPTACFVQTGIQYSDDAGTFTVSTATKCSWSGSVPSGTATCS